MELFNTRKILKSNKKNIFALGIAADNPQVGEFYEPTEDYERKARRRDKASRNAQINNLQI